MQDIPKLPQEVTVNLISKQCDCNKYNHYRLQYHFKPPVLLRMCSVVLLIKDFYKNKMVSLCGDRIWLISLLLRLY